MVATKEVAVHCPECRKKLAESLSEGVLTIWCRRCRKMVCVDRRLPRKVE